MASPPARPVAGRLFLAVSLVLVAFNLRPSLASVGPVLPEALAGTGLSTAESGLVTTLPVLCLGLFGLLAPSMSRRLGLERAVLAFLAVLTAGIGLRMIPQSWALVVGCALGGVAIGVVNVLLPAVVKRDFADRAPLMTGLYTMALCGGAAIAAGATAPLENVMGGDWAKALAVWALPAAAAVLVWAPVAARQRSVGPAPRTATLWRDPLAWQVTLFMGLQSSLAYSIMAWLAPILRERGLSAVEAGFVVSGSILVQVPAALAAPMIAAARRDQRGAVAVTVGLSLVGMAGCVFAPLSSVWLWAIVLGCGQGAVFAVALTIIVLRAPDAALAGRLSSMAQGVGYTIASIGPLTMGLLRASSGGWTLPTLFFIALGLAAGVAGLGAGRVRHVRPGPAPPTGHGEA
jgi:CP family cyanate transporter-like MFS transporter